MTTPDERIARTYQRVLRAEQEYFEKQEQDRKRREERAIQRLTEWAANEAKIHGDYLEQSQICRVNGQLTFVLSLTDEYAVGFDQARSYLFQYEITGEGSPLELRVLAEKKVITNPPDHYGLILTTTEAIEYLIGLHRYQIDRSRLSSLF